MKNYQIQYSQCGQRLWINAPTGECVGRYDTRFGMDIHTSVQQQLKGESQCLHCTHGKSSPKEFDLFCQKAKELWGVEIDKSKIVFQ